MAFTKLAYTSLLLLSLISSSNAQVMIQRRSILSRLVVGIVVGVLCLLALLLLFSVLRRRRARRGFGAAPEGPTPMPLFGGPWFKPHQQEGPPPQEQRWGYGGPPQSFTQGPPVHPQHQYSNGYPPPIVPPPPPPYYPDRSGPYSAPAGQPPSGSAYAPPPGPPPAAHTKGDRGDFVGGFRS